MSLLNIGLWYLAKTFFIEKLGMNYQKIYNQLIQKRRQKPWNSKDGYCEYHHIIPISEGGENTPKKELFNKDGENIIGLQAREHYIAHLLLIKIYNDYKMYLAITRMKNPNKQTIKNKGKFKINNRLFEKLRIKAYQMYGKLLLGKICITNEIKNKYINKNDIVPDGWRYGGKHIKNRKQTKLGSILRKNTMLKNGTNKHKLEQAQKMIQTKRNKGLDISNNWGKKTYTNGIDNIMLFPFQQIPDGFYPGQTKHIIKTKEQKFEIEQKKKQTRKKNGATYITTTGFKWCNNGKINKFLRNRESLPDGFSYGKLQKKVSFKDRIWITNGIKNKFILKSEKILDGWYRGISKK